MNKSVYPGQLNTRIQIVKEVKSSSATGAPAISEEVFKTCYAAQKDLKATEDEDGKIRVLLDMVFVVRYDKNLIKTKANGMFVVDGEGFKYNIVSVTQVIPKRYLQINTIIRE